MKNRTYLITRLDALVDTAHYGALSSISRSHYGVEFDSGIYDNTIVNMRFHDSPSRVLAYIVWMPMPDCANMGRCAGIH